MTMAVFEYLIIISIDFNDWYFSTFSLVLLLVKIRYSFNIQDTALQHYQTT